MECRMKFNSAANRRIHAFYLKWIFFLEDMNTNKDQIVTHLGKKQNKKKSSM